MSGEREVVRAGGRTRGSQRQTKPKSHRALSPKLERQTLSCRQLGANEEFQAGDEMIRTVGRLLSLPCGRQPGKAGEQRQGDGKEGLNHSVHIGKKEAEH